MMEARRMRRFGRGRQSNQSILPVRSSRLSNTISCWYCDFKFIFLNEPLFRFGRRHSRWLRVWFSLGVGFGLAALLGGFMILLWALGRALNLYEGDTEFIGLLNGSLFGFSSTFSGMKISFSAIGNMCISTILSVFVHEAGHAVAAASEGIQMEYVAVFLAVLFPGAVVALNYELLQTLPRFASLRIYCAGVWHNAAFCIVCVLALFILPLMLDPFYSHGESPMVLDVSPRSPLSEYLSHRDLIISLGGTHIHTTQQWKETIGLFNTMKIPQNSKNSSNAEDSMTRNDRKGYCVPYHIIKESISTTLENNRTTCPDEFYMFASAPCLDSHTLEDPRNEENHLQESRRVHCFYPKDIIQLKKCGDGWAKGLRNSSSCSCLEDESCFSPIQMPGLAWVEITFLRPSEGCPMNSFQEYKSVDLEDTRCIHNFVFVGDLISLGHSLHLTSYQPRWEIDIGTYFPDALEKFLICVFHVSLTLGFLNSFPVYFLDGESMLEVVMQYLNYLHPRTRGRVLRLLLLGGTFIFVITFLQIFLLLLR